MGRYKNSRNKRYTNNRTRQNKINPNIINDSYKPPLTADDYKLPETLGNPPKEVQMALDKCFSPVGTLLGHALEGLGEEGLPVFAGYGVLSALTQNGLIRAGVEMRANEMTRKWGELKSTGEDENEVNADEQNDKIKQLEKALKKYKIKDVFNKASSFCGYFGGCLGFIDVGETTEGLANPLTLSPNTIPKGSFKGIKLIEPYNISPGQYNSTNPMADDYYKPNVWYIQGIPVHSSRVLYFSENELPVMLKPAYNFFGLSLSQKVLDAVSHFTANRECASRLLQKYSLTIFKSNMENILSGDFDAELQNRIRYFVQQRDNDGCAVIDKNSEDIVVMTTTLSGVTDLVRQSMEYVAAMFNEPVTKMWGISPAGFNTGDADLQNHYDNIESLQEKIFREPLNTVLKILQLNEFGSVDDSIVFKFAPLSEQDKSLQTDNNKKEAEIANMYAELGVLSPEEIRQKLIDDPDSGYNNLDPYIEPKPDNDPLEPFDPSKDPDEPTEKKVVEVV